MIIELFGAPGAGKTTFARALAAHLGERGHTVDLILSARPEERSPREIRSASDLKAHPSSNMIWRLTHLFAEMLAMARSPFTISHDVATVRTLIKILPPSNTVWSFRLAQYVLRLSRAWSKASDTDHIVLFDQAFVQVVCSLALFCDGADELLISQALDTVPKSDVLIRIDAPIVTLEARLRDRQHLESRIERLLELDLATNLSSLAIVDCLHDLLRKRGRDVTNAESLDKQSLRESLERVEKQIMAQFSIERGESGMCTKADVHRPL